jgi:hypothetical protein
MNCDRVLSTVLGDRATPHQSAGQAVREGVLIYFEDNKKYGVHAGPVPASPHKEKSFDRVLSPVSGDRGTGPRRCPFYFEDNKK